MSTEALTLADNLSTAALIRGAVTMLKVRGWTVDGFYRDPCDGTPANLWPVCAVGALSVADSGDPEAYQEPHVVRALLAINQCFPLIYVDAAEALADGLVAEALMIQVGGWNDSADDVEEIIGVFERTAAALESGDVSGIPPL